ncbi:hypothetical protein TPE_0503 [Treponema pedis str. T A4]|uniref:Uncharacterized protein n=1 Tax=Treponema pedis str. T A4 TaxID=1291379 RepID=S6A806_9SPIR|nr:hypothetical protein TPE_0503 [Treponema pedis str. T A4]
MEAYSKKGEKAHIHTYGATVYHIFKKKSIENRRQNKSIL